MLNKILETTPDLHEVKIAVDSSLITCYSFLKCKGYNILESNSESIYDIHNWLEENNIKAFFTKNWISYHKELPIRNYILYAFDFNRTAEVMADLMECIYINSFTSVYNGNNSQKQNFILVNQTNLNTYGCYI